MASATSVVIALSQGGVEYSWGSARVIVPLILGLFGFVLFGVYEAYLASHPIVSDCGTLLLWAPLQRVAMKK